MLIYFEYRYVTLANFSSSADIVANILSYVADPSNVFDCLVFSTVIPASALRLLNGEDTVTSRCLLAVTTLAIWTKTVLMFSAFDETASLIAMILHIVYDIRYLVLLLFIVTVAFTQALWLLSFPDSTSSYSSMKGGMLQSFQFMLGGYDPLQFSDTYQEEFAIFVSVLFMVIISIILLNLLISLMGSTFKRVERNSVAERYLLKAHLITAQARAYSGGFVSGPKKIFIHQASNDYVRQKDKIAQSNATAVQLQILREQMDLLNNKLDSIIKQKCC